MSPPGDQPSQDPSPLSVIDRTDAAPTARTLVDILRATAARHPSSAAIEDADGTLSYAELLDAAWLDQPGLPKLPPRADPPKPR